MRLGINMDLRTVITMKDDRLISLNVVLDALDEQIRQCDKALSTFDISMKDEYAVKVERASLVAFRETLEYLPSAQPNLSEAYSNAVLTWLMDYQIRAAVMKERYTPYEVLSWVVNDWRKEYERHD